MKKLKSGDKVVVLTGRDKGRESNIEKILADGRAIVKDVNIVKKHLKANPNKGVSGGIVPMEAPIQQSNLALVNPRSGKADRVGIRVHVDEATKKVRRERFFKSDGEAVE